MKLKKSFISLSILSLFVVLPWLAGCGSDKDSKVGGTSVSLKSYHGMIGKCDNPTIGLCEDYEAKDPVLFSRQNEEELESLCNGIDSSISWGKSCDRSGAFAFCKKTTFASTKGGKFVEIFTLDVFKAPLTEIRARQACQLGGGIYSTFAPY